MEAHLTVHHLYLKGCTVQVPFWLSPGLHRFRSLAPLRRRHHRAAPFSVPCTTSTSCYHQGCSKVPCAAPLTSSSGSHCLGPLYLIADVAIGVALSRSPVSYTPPPSSNTTLRVPGAAIIPAEVAAPSRTHTLLLNYIILIINKPLSYHNNNILNI
ncbi:hypothetical protein Zmor_014536 [Zophobas morio]|uniref:Uncharacterized protein n=1 Tax=Zophobas morio TaxID=2755281 RepID=A0AA38MGX8_9CUCU|nr:hypothetical protein Zmor_014536 [Zophobas morio]